jgi:hypothetical protein
MSFVVDFYSNGQWLGGTAMDGDAAKVLSFARDGLERHNALWARVIDQSVTPPSEQRICANVIERHFELGAQESCPLIGYCSNCPVLDAKAPKAEFA